MQDTHPQVVALLSRIALFKGLNAEQIDRMADRFELFSVDPGTRLFTQGERPDAFYLILSGKVRISRKNEGGERVLANFVSGDYFGEEPLLYGLRRLATATAVEPSVILRMDKEGFGWLVREFPQVKLALQATIKTRRLARRRTYPWLGEDETIYLMARKHKAALFTGLIAPVMVGWLSLASFYLAFTIDRPSVQLVLNGLGAIIFVAMVLWGIWIWIDWGNDYYIVTSQRVVWLEKVVGIYDSRQEAPLSTVLTVDVQTDQIGRMLGYGDVIVRTFTGQIVMKQVAYPYQLASLLGEFTNRSKEVAQKIESQMLEREIRVRLGMPEDPNLPPITAPITVKPALKKHPGSLRSSLDDFFKVRFEEGGVVTFRKHWILLLRDIWLPTLILFLLAAAVVGRILDLYETFSIGLVLLVSFTLGLICIVWWVYQYVDWRNDIYQLTSDQIIDIYRKPLGREDKKTAQVENILSLENKRRGILGLILNYGDVTAMVGGAKFLFEGVYNPASVQQEIFHRINERKRQMREAEASRERERIASWLAAYHRQTNDLKRLETPPDESQNSE
ncbi:MAG: cyclic nucleotide-binding domain-containing protein [Omnitrophica WOR_2 bacterium]